MNETEHLFTILMEECCEIAQRASKAKRFGIREVQPEQSLTNAERLMGEYADLVGVVEMLQDRGLLREVDPRAVAAKKEKVTKFLEYSKQMGTLTESDPRAEAERRLVGDLRISREIAQKLVNNGINCLAACEGTEASDFLSMGFDTKEALSILDGMRKAGV